MKRTNIFTRRSLMLTGYVFIIVSTLACQVLAGGVQVDDGSLQLDDGVIVVKNDDGDQSPVAGTSTFDLVGVLEGMDPWKVAGVTLQTNDATQIAEGLQVGDIVRVRGTILDDDTWLAYSMELAQEQTDPIIILIGVVDSIDPWVVNGIDLNVTDETDIQGEITVGMVVRVEILLLPDGTWEVLSIAPLGDTIETSGCATVIATVVNVNGNEIQFLGWPTVVKFEPNTQTDNSNDNADNGRTGEEDSDDENENGNGDDGVTVNAGDVVVAVICVSEDGSLIIVQIILLDADETGQDGEVPTEGEKVLVCHKPNKKGGHTLSLPQSAVPAHLGHGDTLGACPNK